MKVPAFGPRSLLARIMLFGVGLLLLAGLTELVVVRVFLRPSGDAGRRGAIAWVCEHALEKRSDPEGLARELRDISVRLQVDMAVFTATGARIAGEGVDPLTAAELAALKPGTVLDLTRRRGYAYGVFEAGKLVSYAKISRAELPGAAPVFAFVFVLAVLMIVAVSLSRSIARPLAELASAARRFGSGDQSARSLSSSRRDEFGEVARAFNDMADDVEKSRRKEKELLANVSHELRTPLARIRVVLELASEGDAVAVRRYLHEIEGDLGEMEALLSDIIEAARLDLAHARSGDPYPPLRLAAVDLAALLSEEALRQRDRDSQREVRCELEPGLPAVEGDAPLLKRVFDNLAENARKHGGPGVPITLSAARHGDTVVVSVRDAGGGIAPEDLPHLFTPFFRADPSRARATGGAGLGLTLVKRVVDAHQGTITVDSELGKGTTVKVVLPIARAGTELSVPLATAASPTT